MKKTGTIALILASVAIAGQIFIFATHKNPCEEQQQGDATPKTPVETKLKIYAPPIPDTMTLAGEPVPLNTYYVREGLDRELIVNTYGHTNTILYIKRANRYFPIIEPILKEQGVPDDFKYLCVAESGLTNATSPAKAQGFWQFMKATGQKYGLEVNDEIDMRNDLEASTVAACKFLKVLYKDLGSWTAAAAAYNCGGGGLSRNFEKQSIDSYYDARLNAETSRYIYRILALKQIMQHPQDYGFYLRRCDLYPALPKPRTATLSGQNVDLYDFAKKNGTTYKMLRELNPWITTDKLVNKAKKSYTVKLPAENGTSLKHILSNKDKSTDFITRM